MSPIITPIITLPDLFSQVLPRLPGFCVHFSILSSWPLYAYKDMHRIYVYISCIYYRKRGVEERERERGIHMREQHGLVASHMCSDWGLNPQPRHVPWLGIKPSAFWYMGRCSLKSTEPSGEDFLDLSITLEAVQILPSSNTIPWLPSCHSVFLQLLRSLNLSSFG